MIEVSGGCLCGRIRWRVADELIRAGYCHCARCRRLTGAVATNWIGFRDNALRFSRGRPAEYRSAGLSRGLCRDCGSSLTYQAEHFPGCIQLRLGSLDNADAGLPMAQAHCAEKSAWFEVSGSLPRFPGSAAADGADWKS